MDGRFRGWVAERACDALGIARTAEAHWSTNAGAETRPSGKESAKAFALRMMRVNPNAFFYRHNLPGEAARHGEWSQQEIDRFVAVATEHGAGDKWGLFASHIPGRVWVRVLVAVPATLHPQRLADGRQLPGRRARGGGVGGTQKSTLKKK